MSALLLFSRPPSAAWLGVLLATDPGSVITAICSAIAENKAWLIVLAVVAVLIFLWGMFASKISPEMGSGQRVSLIAFGAAILAAMILPGLFIKIVGAMIGVSGNYSCSLFG